MLERVWILALMTCAAGTLALEKYQTFELSFALLPNEGPGIFSVSLGGEVWFKSAPVRVYVDNRWHSSDNGTLELLHTASTKTSANLSWTAKPSGTKVKTSIAVLDVDQQSSSILFEIAFPGGATGTCAACVNQTSTPLAISEFPAFAKNGGRLPTLNNLVWTSTFCNGLEQGRGAPRGGKDKESPTVLYQTYNGTTVVFDP